MGSQTEPPIPGGLWKNFIFFYFNKKLYSILVFMGSQTEPPIPEGLLGKLYIDKKKTVIDFSFYG